MNFARLVAAVWLMASVVQAAAPPALVRTGRVEQRDVQNMRLVMGRIEPARRSMVAAEEPGRVVQAPPEPGTAVSSGAALTRIDTWLLELEKETAEAQFKLAEAQVAERQAQLDTLQRARKRLEELVVASVANPRELQDSKSEEGAASSRLRVTEAILNQARTSQMQLSRRLEKSVVLAPFDAVIVAKHTEVGQWVAKGEAVAELVQIDRVKVRLEVPQEAAGRLQPGQEIDLQVESADFSCQAPIFSIVPDADPQSRSFRVLVKLDNPQRKLLPGMSARAYVPGEAGVKQMRTVPRDAVLTIPSGRGVFLIDNSVAKLVRVEVLQPLGDRYVVAGGGLEEGQEVVVQGNERLRDGQAVKVIFDAVPSAAP